MTYEQAIEELKRVLPYMQASGAISSTKAGMREKLTEAIETVIAAHDVPQLLKPQLEKKSGRTYLDAIATDSCKVTKPTKE